jgi:hypothetical protein
VKRAAHFVYLEMFWPGLLVPLVGRVRHWKLTALLSVAAAVAVFALWQVKSGLVEQGQSTVNELSYTWLQPALSNPVPVYCVGAALTIWLFAGIAERTWPGLVALVRRRRQPEPGDFLYLVPVLLFAGTYLASAGFLDRYWVPILPFLLVGGLAQFKALTAPALAPNLAVFALVAVYGIASHLDDYDSVGASWQAGRWLVSQGVPYDKMLVTYSWDGYYMADEAIKRLGSHDINVIGRVFPPYKVIDPEYVASTVRQQGYNVLKTFPYLSRLGGFSTREVYAMQRAP